MPSTTYAPTRVARAPSPANACVGNIVSLVLPLTYPCDGRPSQTKVARFTLLQAVGGHERPPHIHTQKEKANLISQTGLY
jgi:hypothetical protein